MDDFWKIIFSGYLHHNRNLYSKFYVSSFSSLGSALIYQSVSFSFYIQCFFSGDMRGYVYPLNILQTSQEKSYINIATLILCVDYTVLLRVIIILIAAPSEGVL